MRLLRLLDARIPQHRVDASSGENLFSAACGEDRTIAGGKIVQGINSLYLNYIRIFRGRGLEEMAAAVIVAMREAAATAQNQFLRIRAGGVSINDGALILPSAPAQHLSGLTALLAQRGAAYLGDEMVKIDPVERYAYGIDLPPLIDTPDIPLFPGVERTVTRRGSRTRYLHAMTPRSAVTLDELGARRGKPAPVRWIVFPTFQPGAETTFESIGESPALFRFIEAGLNLHVWGERGFLLMRELLAEATVFHLVVGSLPEAADRIMSTVPN